MKEFAAVFVGCVLAEVWAISELAEQDPDINISFPMLVGGLALLVGGYAGFVLLFLLADVVWESPAKWKQRRENARRLAAAAEQARDASEKAAVVPDVERMVAAATPRRTRPLAL